MNKKLLTSSIFFATSIAMAFEPWICSKTQTPHFVNTGLANATGTAGYWFVKNDAEEGGDSKVVWPVTANKSSPDSLAPIIDFCKGVCGTADLNKGTLTYTPFITLGFNVAGEDAYGAPQAGDASEWGGICITYRSDIALYPELSLGDAIDAEIGYALPTRSIPKATDGTKKCIPWSDFKQPSWYKGATKISGPDAAKQLVSINFKIQGSQRQYNFNICAIGPYGDGSGDDLPETCPLPYIDKKGKPQITYDVVALTSDEDKVTELDGGWYVAMGTVNMAAIKFNSDAHLILANGARLYVNTASGGNAIEASENLTIYGQSGILSTLGDNNSIYSKGDVTIVGGNIWVLGTNGINSNGNITIGWSTTPSYIQATNYIGTVSIADGKLFEDEEGNLYSGLLNHKQIAAIAGKKLKSFEIGETNYAAVTIDRTAEGAKAITKAIINGEFGDDGKVKIPEEIKVKEVTFNRKFLKDTYSTIVLPFSVNTEKVSELNAVLYYNGIGTDANNNDAIKMKVLWAKDGIIKDDKGNSVSYDHTVMEANTPYLVLMNSETFAVEGPVTIVPTAKAVTKYPEWDWEFRGMWEFKRWDTGDRELGYAYGFAASSPKDSKIKVGDFVKIGEGTHINPLRAYLVSSNIPEAQGVRANGAYVKRPAVVQKELPELMSVIIDGLGDNGNGTTVIGQFNTRTGEFKMNNAATKRTFDVKGRNVGSKANNARGAYYGKKTTARHPER